MDRALAFAELHDFGFLGDLARYFAELTHAATSLFAATGIIGPLGMTKVEVDAAAVCRFRLAERFFVAAAGAVAALGFGVPFGFASSTITSYASSRMASSSGSVESCRSVM